MKKTKALLQITFLLFCYSNSFCQSNIKIAPKILSFKQTKVSLGILVEGGLMLDASKKGNLDMIYKMPGDTGLNIPSASYGIILDLYSAKSVLGLSSGFIISKSEFGFKSEDSYVDYFNTTKLDLPIYLKFRFGPSNGKKHVLFMVGGIYSIPQKCTRELFIIDNDSHTALFEDENIKQLSNYFSVSGQVGYEIFLDDVKHFRIVFFSRFVHPMGNELKSDYPEFKSGGNSLLGRVPNFAIKGNGISLGIKFKFQFGEGVKILASSTQK